MSKSNHERTSDANQKKVEFVEDRTTRVRERQIRQALHNISLDDDFDDLDWDCRERRHHKATLK